MNFFTRGILLLSHIALIVWCMIMSFVSWNYKVLVAIIFILYTISTQWNIFGRCVLNKLEKEDQSDDINIVIKQMSAWTGLPVSFVEKLWPLPTNYVPAMLCLAKLAILSSSSG